MHRITEFAVGLLFGLGLILAGMTDPGKVIGFLDLAGRWDPSLALVMGGAIAASGRLCGGSPAHDHLPRGGMQLPTASAIDRRLVIGSLVFGAGWGLAGFCPGPALVAAGAGHWQAWVFTAAMLAGMWVHELSAQGPTPQPSASP